MPAAHEVWARTVLAAVEMVAVNGLPTDDLFTGLPFDAASLKRLKRVAWDDYCTIVERIDELAAGELEDLLEAGYHKVFPELRAAAGAMIGPKQLCWFASEIGNPILFPPISHMYEDLGENRIRVASYLRAGARPCKPFFVGSIGAWRGLPRMLGLPAAKVLAADVTGEHGIYELELPPSRTLATRARRAAGLAVQLLLGREPDGTPYTAIVGNRHDLSETRLERASSTWKLTPRQAEVLRCILEGDSNKDIALALGCAENTIELHVTNLLRRAGVTSRTQLVARFWSETWGFPQ